MEVRRAWRTEGLGLGKSANVSFEVPRTRRRGSGSVQHGSWHLTEN